MTNAAMAGRGTGPVGRTGARRDPDNRFRQQHPAQPNGQSTGRRDYKRQLAGQMIGLVRRPGGTQRAVGNPPRPCLPGPRHFLSKNLPKGSHNHRPSSPGSSSAAAINT